MIRVQKLTDYAMVLLANFAAANHEKNFSARELAEESRISLATTSKLLKILQRSHILSSSRGVQGGYKLARDPFQISALEIIETLEGPIQITECTKQNLDCVLSANCPTKEPWQKINEAINTTLSQISLADMSKGHT